MAQKSSIEWTESTWNPTTGCSKVSPGCKHCYAERLSLRLQEMGQAKYANGFQLTLHEDVLKAPLRWKKSQMIFVNSMSDLFHEQIPLSFLLSTFDIMSQAHWHVFQILTKRSEYLLQVDPEIQWPSNVWMGVSVENENYTFRIDHLRSTNADIKFLSLEPLLGPLPNLDLEKIDWVIVGGESGPGARPVMEDWILNIRDQCLDQNVPFFFKQWGGVNKKKNGRHLEGQTWNELPVQKSRRNSVTPQIDLYSTA